jgi:putative MFS transporter
MNNQIDMQRSRAEQIAAITARLNCLPPSRYIWRLVVLLSFCGFFEIYEIALTAFLSPGLIREGIFHAGAKGFFGLADQASFAAATFVGFFVGAALFSSVADKYGRRAVLTYSLLW